MDFTHTCSDPTCACHQLAAIEQMERIEQEVFPDARPRHEVLVELTEDDDLTARERAWFQGDA